MERIPQKTMKELELVRSEKKLLNYKCTACKQKGGLCFVKYRMFRMGESSLQLCSKEEADYIQCNICYALLKIPISLIKSCPELALKNGLLFKCEGQFFPPDSQGKQRKVGCGKLYKTRADALNCCKEDHDACRRAWETPAHDKNSSQKSASFFSKLRQLWQ